MLCLAKLTDRRGRVIDEILAVHSSAPNTYTGEDTVELQCHGAPAVLAAGLDALFAAGARQAGPGEFTKRAFLNGRMDLSQAEAVVDLIDAETADAAANAAGQVGGALVRKIDPIYDAMTDICSHFQGHPALSAGGVFRHPARRVPGSVGAARQLFPGAVSAPGGAGRHPGPPERGQILPAQRPGGL